MSFWFEDPTLKALAPLALSTSIKGLSTLFCTPPDLCRLSHWRPPLRLAAPIVSLLKLKRPWMKVLPKMKL